MLAEYKNYKYLEQPTMFSSGIHLYSKTGPKYSKYKIFCEGYRYRAKLSYVQENNNK